jgi:hypothetical protein
MLPFCVAARLSAAIIAVLVYNDAQRNVAIAARRERLRECRELLVHFSSARAAITRACSSNCSAV